MLTREYSKYKKCKNQLKILRECQGLKGKKGKKDGTSTERWAFSSVPNHAHRRCMGSAVCLCA